MFEGKDVKVILANAGAGKTRYIIDDIMHELKTRRPEEVAFVTFTRKGAQEGLHRMCNLLNVTPDDLPYFRTLHSLTFHALNLSTKQMFNHLHQRAFNKMYGYNLNRAEANNNTVMPTRDSKYLDFYDMERSGALTSKQIAEADIEMVYYHQLVRKYEEYKRTQCLVDFFDCLLKYVQEGDSLPCKTVYIDECQDLTLLQWKVAEKAFANAEKVRLVGDIKQSIFSYSGARPDFLLSLAKQFPLEHLAMSYRLPRKVFDLANALTRFMSERTDEPTVFREENVEGSITQLNTADRLVNYIKDSDAEENKSDTTWYILARNNCFLPKVCRALEDRLIPYWTSDGFFMGGQIMSRLKNYQRFSLKGGGEESKKEKFKKTFGITDFTQPFTATSLFTEDRKWVYASYIEKYGLQKLEEMCKWNPQILVSTIHHVKGGEAKNVAVLLDMTRRTEGEIFDDLDSELRILYVAVTRTKENLYLIDSQDGTGYDRIIETVKEENRLEW